MLCGCHNSGSSTSEIPFIDASSHCPLFRPADIAALATTTASVARPLHPLPGHRHPDQILPDLDLMNPYFGL